MSDLGGLGVRPDLPHPLPRLGYPLLGVSVDRVTICTQDPALGNFRHDRGKRIASALDHVRRVDDLARARPVFGGRVDVIKLEGSGMGIESAHLATALNLDTVGDRSGCALICSHE
jgi:hypothetical protein